jgi:cell wall-associated NlpC family hydrolase
VPTHALRSSALVQFDSIAVDPIAADLTETPLPAVAGDDQPTPRGRTLVTRLLALLALVVAVASLGACTAPSSSTKGAQIANLARSHIGAPYSYGASGPGSFDCSGLVQYVHRQAGINLPRTSGGQLAAARPVSKSAGRPGDVVFIGNYHVGIYMGNGQMIDAPKTGERVQQRAIWTSGYTLGRFN